MKLRLVCACLLIASFTKAQNPEVVIQDGHPVNGAFNTSHFFVSSDNNYVVTYNERGMFKLWDFFTKRQIRRFDVNMQGLRLASAMTYKPYFSKPSISGDNNYIITEGNNDATAYSIWNTNTGKIDFERNTNNLGEPVNYNIAVFDDANAGRILTHGVNRKKNKYEISAVDLQNNAARIFNYETPLRIGKKNASVHDPDWRACMVAASSNLDYMAIGTTDGRIYVFNTRKLKGNETKTITADMEFMVDTTNVSSLCFSADGKLLTTATRKGAWIWNTQNGKMVSEYLYPTYSIDYGNYKIPQFYGTLSPQCNCMVKRNKAVNEDNGTEPVTRFYELPAGKFLRELPITNQSTLISYDDNEWYTEDGRYQFSMYGLVVDKTDLTDSSRTTDMIVSNRIQLNQTFHPTHAILDAVTQELFIGKVFNDALIFNLATGQSDRLRNFTYTPDTSFMGRYLQTYGMDYHDERNIFFSRDKKRILTYDAKAPVWHAPKAIIWDRAKKIPVTWIDDIKGDETTVSPLRSFSKNKEYISWINDFFTSSKLFARPARYVESKEKDENGISKSVTPIEIVDNTQKVLRVIYPWGEKTPTADHAKHVSYITNGWVLSPDGKNLYTGMNDGSILTFDIGTGKQLKLFNERVAEETAVPPNGKGRYNPVEAITTDSKGKFLFVARNDSNFNYFIAQYEISSGRIIQQFRSRMTGVNTILADQAGRMLITVLKDNKIVFWDIATGKQAATMVFGEKDYVLSIPEGYYMASRKGAAMMHYVNQKKVYLFEQFDLQYNRPDIVLKKLGYASEQTIRNYLRAYEKRITRAGFNPASFGTALSINAPSIQIINPPARRQRSQRNLQLQIKTTDNQYNIGKLQVRINGVPAFGLAGIDVSSLHSRSVNRNIDIVLSAGKNIVEVSSLNEKGVESLRETLELEVTGIAEQPVLYLVGIGASKYADAKNNLDYAAKDAADLVKELAKNSHGFKETKQIILADNQVTKANIMNLEETLSKTGIDDRIIIFYAGHGLFNKNADYYLGTYDIDFANPEKNGLLFSDVEKLLEKIPARDKIVFIDACHSGEIDKAETNLVKSQKVEYGDQKMRSVGNFVPGAEHVGLVNSFELMKQTFADVTFRSGSSIISAARGGEYAMESAKLKNGVFTFCLLKGLTEKTADQNGDGKIFLSELQQYLEFMVAKLTGGKQQPTSRAENLVKDVRIW